MKGARCIPRFARGSRNGASRSSPKRFPTTRLRETCSSGGLVSAVDLIVATVGRERELAELLASVRAQAPVDVCVIVVDQNDDDRLERILRDEADGLAVVHVRAKGGASAARTRGLAEATAELVAWPDDDCSYPPGLLAHVVARFAAEPSLDVLVGRIVDRDGRKSTFAERRDGSLLDARSLWRHASAPTYFARRSAALRVGDWSERFGPGPGSVCDSGEDTDWLIRAVKEGLSVHYDPSAQVLHEDVFALGSASARRRARRYGRCTTTIALTHGYGWAFVLGLVARAAGGVVVSAAGGRLDRAAVHAYAMLGRIEGAVRRRR